MPLVQNKFTDDMGILGDVTQRDVTQRDVTPQNQAGIFQDDMGILGEISPAAPDTAQPELEQGVLPAIKYAAKETGKEALRAVGQVLGAPGRLMTMTSKAIPYLTLIAAGQLDKMTWGPEWQALEKQGLIKKPYTFETGLKEWAQEALTGLSEIQDRLTFTDEPYTDIGLSVALGGGAAAGTRKLLERTASMAALARKAGTAESLAVTFAKGGVAAATGDVLIVDPAIKHLIPRIDDSELSPRAKTLLKSTLPLLIGVASGFTLEYRIDKLLKNPLVTGVLDDMVRKGAVAEDVKERFFKTLEETPGPEMVERPLTGAPERYRAGEERPRPEIRITEEAKFVDDIGILEPEVAPRAPSALPEGFDPEIHSLVKNEAGEWTAVLKEEAPHVVKFEDDMGILEPKAAPEAVIKPEPTPEVRPKPDAEIENLLAKAIKKAEQETVGQDMLEQLSEQGIAPRIINDEFWKNTYQKLSPEIQKRFQVLLRRLTGFELGDVLAVDRTGKKEIAESWEHIGKSVGDDLSIDALNLEGTERGYVVLMGIANQQLREQAPQKALKALKKPPKKPTPKAEPAVLNKLEKDSLAYLAEDLRHGQGPVTTRKEPDAGEGAGGVYGRLPSINPDWFKDMIAKKIIRTKSEVFTIISKALAGKKLTPRQTKIRDYLYDAADKEWEKFLSPEELAIKQEKGWAGLPDDTITLMMHPSTITGPIGGIAYGVDWEELRETGQIKIDPKKVLIGLAVGTMGGRLLTRGRKPHIFNKIATKWDEKFAAPYLDRARRWASGLIVNEDIRTSLGLGRSQKFRDYMRNFQRNIETSYQAAAKIGRELAEIAPTQLEQRRLMQIIRGGITASPALREKAKQVQKLFNDLRGELKEYNLIQYSRFDKLTRAERTEIRRLISGPNPFTTDNPQALEEYARWFDIDAKEIMMRTGDQKAVQREIAVAIEFHRSRLNDYFHYGSAKEYAPIYYIEKEGLTPTQRDVLIDEIKRLKITSRRGLPEGQQKLEAQIAGMETMLAGGKEARKALRVKRRELNLSYSHRRMDMPIEVQKAMGLIEEAPYPVAKMVAVQTGDIHKARLFQYVAGNFDWAIRVGKKEVVPANYTKVSGDEYGILDGMYVRNDIWNDLREVEEWRGAFVRNWDKMQGIWKYGKVVLNPATHARNTMSNFILAYYAGVNPTDMVTYGKAIKAMKAGENNQFYKEAADWGLYNNTFVSAEIIKLRDELDGLRDMPALKRWFRRLASLPADAYQGNEKLFKTAVFIKMRENGMSVDDAARHAEKHLFNYGDLPPFAKSIKRWVSPFFTFTYKAIPLFAEMTIRKPHKTLAIMAFMYGMEKYSNDRLGLSEDEAEINRARMPEWQSRKLFDKFGPRTQVLMPFRDKWGNMLTWDISYILPFGNIAEEWGQSSIPLADFLPSSPLFNLLATIRTNRKGFTGQPVYDEDLDSGLRILYNYLDMAWKELVPSLAPGGYSFNTLKTGIQNTFFGKDVRDWADRPIELQTAILKTLMGIKLTPINEQKLLENELRIRNRIRSAVSRRKRGEKRKYKRKEITRDELEERFKELNQLLKKKLKKRPN